MKQPLAGPRYKPPTPAIKVGTPDTPEPEARYATILVAYMRTLGLLWMSQGLFLWSGVLLTEVDGADLFETVSFVRGGAIVFFCVLDLIAAVGLWLAAPWGGVIWLVAVSAQWMAALILPGLFPHDRLVALLDLLLVVGYICLTYVAARESETAAN